MRLSRGSTPFSQAMVAADKGVDARDKREHDDFVILASTGAALAP